MIIYKEGYKPDIYEVIELYKASTLAQRRPVENVETAKKMMYHANLVITAWDGDKLVGISRSFSDFVYITYLSDLAVHIEYQKQGIGKKLIEETRNCSGPETTITLLAAPASIDYYPKIGLKKHSSSWLLTPNGKIL